MFKSFCHLQQVILDDFQLRKNYYSYEMVVDLKEMFFPITNVLNYQPPRIRFPNEILMFLEVPH